MQDAIPMDRLRMLMKEYNGFLTMFLKLVTKKLRIISVGLCMGVLP